MLEALKDHIIKSVGGSDDNWVIKYINIKDLTDPSENNINSNKLLVYIKEIKKGSIFPPIVVSSDKKVIDGTHRLKAYKALGEKKIPALISVGKGTGKVLYDYVFEPMIKKLKDHDLDFYLPGAEPPKCLNCGAIMTFVPYGLNISVSAFPEGMPVGPYYFCAKDRIIVSKKSFIGWACVKKA